MPLKLKRKILTDEKEIPRFDSLACLFTAVVLFAFQRVPLNVTIGNFETGMNFQVWSSPEQKFKLVISCDSDYSTHRNSQPASQLQPA